MAWRSLSCCTSISRAASLDSHAVVKRPSPPLSSNTLITLTIQAVNKGVLCKSPKISHTLNIATNAGQVLVCLAGQPDHRLAEVLSIQHTNKSRHTGFKPLFDALSIFKLTRFDPCGHLLSSLLGIRLPSSKF